MGWAGGWGGDLVGIMKSGVLVSWYCSLRGQINSTLKPVICTLLYELKKIATILFNLALQVHEARMAAEKDVDMAMVAMEVSERNVLMMSTSYEL